MDFVSYDRPLAVAKPEFSSRSRGLTVSGDLQSNAADRWGYVGAACLADLAGTKQRDHGHL